MSIQAIGQGSLERRALKSMERGRWEKANAQLTKALLKDSLSSGATYLLATYYFSPDNPRFHTDTAYQCILKAMRDFQISPEKQRDRLRRISVDSMSMVMLQRAIDSAAFESAKTLNTEKSYIRFLEIHTTARERSEAIILRNEAAYGDAVKENTYQAFLDYMNKYPDASRMPDASAHYNNLLFQAKTADKRLSSYEKYHLEYPESPYRTEVEKAIFEIRTADGRRESFTEFLDRYGDGIFSAKARKILFHLIPEDRRAREFAAIESDSIASVLSGYGGYLVPFYHNGKFGFMNQTGKEVIAADADGVESEYICGNISSDVIALPNKLVTSIGDPIFEGPFDSVEDIGLGFILVHYDECSWVVHKSGFRTGQDCIQDAKILGERFLALKNDSRWSVWALSGRMLLPYDFDDVFAIKDVMALQRGERITLATASSIAQTANQAELHPTCIVDEVKAWRNDLLWVGIGEVQGILDLTLDTLVRLEKQRLSPTYFGGVSLHDDGARTVNDLGRKSNLFHRIEVRAPWTAVKVDSTWRLYDPVANGFLSPSYDSIVFEGPFAVGRQKDSLRIYFSPSIWLTISKPAEITFVPGRDSSAFLLLNMNDKRYLYSLKGKRLFHVPFDNIQYAGEGFFTVVKKGKKGLLSATGKMLLPPEFDAIGTVSQRVVSLLKGSNFGLYHGGRRKLIKPQYDKNLTCYNATVNVVFKEGKYGFVDWDNKPLSTMEFDEVVYWNDTASLVRKDYSWKIYNIKTKKVLLDKIRGYTLIRDGRDDKLAVVQQERNYGVIHNRLGTTIPISFSDIINVGSKENPFYFTEKHVEEASIFVVIYYDSDGIMVRKEVYEQDEYEKIYCSNN